MIKYYAYAFDGKNIGQLLVTVINGRTSQEWTGKKYGTVKEASADMERLNCVR